jgi:hypothetical protein
MSTLTPYAPEEGYHEIDLETAERQRSEERASEQTSKDSYCSRTYTTISGRCTSARDCITKTANNICGWATDPNTRVGFALIALGLCSGVASLSLVGAYEDCLESDSDACNKETTTTTCSKNKNTGKRTCTTSTTSYEEDLLSSAIGFGAAAVFCVGAGVAKLTCGSDISCDCDW